MIGAKALERVNSAMATVMKDTWSADLMDEAQAIYNSLEDSMDDLEEMIEATWPNVTPEIQTMLCDFEVNSSFNALATVKRLHLLDDLAVFSYQVLCYVRRDLGISL